MRRWRGKVDRRLAPQAGWVLAILVQASSLQFIAGIKNDFMNFSTVANDPLDQEIANMDSYLLFPRQLR
jgi:hypothetical protein